MRILAVLALVFVTGCATELTWKTIPGSAENTPRSLRFRTADEIWVVGTDPMMIRNKGSWSTVKLCFEDRAQLAEIAFDGDGVVWAHCTLNRTTITHTLLRYDAQKVAREVPLPAGETAFALAQTGATIRLMGAKSFYRWESDAWTAVATYAADDRYGVGSGIGISPDDFYVDAVERDGPPISLFWEKDHFTKTTIEGATSNRLTLRNGELYDGATRFVGGKRVPLPESADLAERGVRLAAAIDGSKIGYLTMPPSTAYEGSSGGGIWLSESAGDLEFLGHAPFSTGNLSRGGGFSFFAMIDEDHVLIGVSPGAAGGPLSGGKLVEGSR